MAKHRRSIVLTLLAFFILGLALWNGLRLFESFVFRSVFTTYRARLGILYISLTGGFWSLAGLATFLGIWFEKVWACLATLINVLGYASWWWLDRLIFQYPHLNWPFALVTTFFLLMIPIILVLHSGPRRVFLKGSDERKS
jgi:hypothetical protein